MRTHTPVRHVLSFFVIAFLGLGLSVLEPFGASAVAASPRSATAPAAPMPRNIGLMGVMQAAGSVLGHPYRWGGASPGGFDCSGLVRWSFATSGRYLPHSSGAQRAATTPIGAGQAMAGDLVFFGNPTYHVGIYMGAGLMIHAPRAGKTVSITSIHNMGATPQFGRVK